jgi:hypothetical protein
MKAKFIFFISSTIIFILSIIAICCAPIINKLHNNFDNWKSLNCEFYSDSISPHDIELKDFDNNRYLYNLCRRQKAMYNLEYASLIITASLSFICFYLSLLLQLDIGRGYKNKTSLIGFISGIICFILTLVYACFSGYIFNNDIAFGKVELNTLSLSNGIKKLFPNGAKYKWNKNKYINAYENDYDDYAIYIKYKDLGDKRYSYDNDIYKRFGSDDPCFVSSGSDKPTSYIHSCDYIFEEPNEGISRKYLYDRWLTTLVLSCLIFVFNICLSIFGFSLYKDKSEEFEPINTSVPNALQINTNTHNNNNLVLLNENSQEDKNDELKQKDLNDKEMDVSKNHINNEDNELIKKDIDNKNINKDKDHINKINKNKDTVNDIDNKDVDFKKIEFKDDRKKEDEDKNKETKKEETRKIEIKKKEDKNKEIKMDKININKINIDDIEDNNENNQVNINNLISNENNNNELISNENNEEDDDLILKENKNNLIDKESKDRINKEQKDKQDDVKERKESEIKHTDNKKDDDNKEPNQGNSNRNATDNNNIDINQINQMDINEGDMEII